MNLEAALPKGSSTRLVQAFALLVVFGIAWLAVNWDPAQQAQLGVVAAIGFLLLSGTLLSELLEPLGLPHLSGYLLAGLLSGPYIAHLFDHATVDRLAPVNTLTLALIALGGGAELRMNMLRSLAKSVSVAMVLQCGLVFVVMVVTFMLLAPYITFTQQMPFMAVLGVALLWAVLGVSRSPSACMAILSQTRAKGPVANFALAFIMASDVVVVVMMAAALMIARPMISGSGALSWADFNLLGQEILGSISLGTTLGLLLAGYLRLVGHNLPLILLALGFCVTAFMRYVHIDPLLSFLTAGFVVQNLTAQGEKLLGAVHNMSSVVFVVFFATAGAHLDLLLLAQMWPIALALCAVRAFSTIGVAKLSSRVARDPEPIRRWGWAPLISQAGLTLGLSVVVVRAFPEFGAGFRSLVIATVAINEVVGPICFKYALDRAGEVEAHGIERQRNAHESVLPDETAGSDPPQN